MTPLDGVKVVELARILAGPWAGQTLSDLGADVIKVEAPEGDDTRRWGPPFVTQEDDTSAAYFYATNRGKKSVTCDFRTAEGQQMVRDLVADADVLIENFKVGGLAKYALAMAKLRPRSGFHQLPCKNSTARPRRSALPRATSSAPALRSTALSSAAEWLALIARAMASLRVNERS